MTTFSTNDDNFEKDIAESKVSVLVDFWAEWCGPCKQIGPILEEIAIEHESKIKVLKINIDENPQAPSKYGVMSIPTLILFKNGQVEAVKMGLLSKSQLSAFVESNV
mgnify:CR=1 FL=1